MSSWVATIGSVQGHECRKLPFAGFGFFVSLSITPGDIVVIAEGAKASSPWVSGQMKHVITHQLCMVDAVAAYFCKA